jgi:hypothetical protein
MILVKGLSMAFIYNLVADVCGQLSGRGLLVDIRANRRRATGRWPPTALSDALERAKDKLQKKERRVPSHMVEREGR